MARDREWRVERLRVRACGGCGERVQFDADEHRRRAGVLVVDPPDEIGVVAQSDRGVVEELEVNVAGPLRAGHC